jgi:pyruvate-ferredoxin/flavodoxin oxidoreductase
MEHGLRQQKLAVESGYWPLMRYNPDLRRDERNPFMLDSPRPTIPLRDYAYKELRYDILRRTNPDQADLLMKLAQENVNLKWRVYEEMATRGDPEYHFAKPN